MTRKLSVLLLSFSLFSAYGQEISVKEEYIEFPTYPFNDPDPVARPGKIFPYFRFDGYSAKPVSQKHKMVVLENRWIKLWVAPDIGGKVWGAQDKKTGKYFIYHNNVIKFRDIAMRGPWTSGGIEFNFGSIGHAPTTVTPVDYHFQYNADGSASCFVGAMELTSRTQWRVEIRLPADKAWFETRSYWHNPTNLKTSLYHWQTAAADAADDLKFYYPGTAHIGHGGEASEWPVSGNGRDISLYRNNDFGGSKSYHVLGEYTDWFAGYYQNDGFGFGHWSRYPYKPGKKIWIWALSRSGAIWENLLTDPDKGNKQYVEIQTGLLFNQESDGSTMSPFKHMYFEPGAVESFRERWFPISGTKGAASISQEGILNIEKNAVGFNLIFQSLAFVKDVLQVTDTTGKILYEYLVDLIPQQIFENPIAADPKNVIVRLKDGELFHDMTGRRNTVLDRPLEMPEGFDWNSVYGLYIRGVEKSEQRLYSDARSFYNRCLEKDPNYIPAYTGLAEIDFKEMKYDEAEKRLLHAISFDTYDPDANFLYGTILAQKKQYNKARDAFGVTLRSPAYKSAALNQIALIALREKRLEEAWEYAMNAGLYNGLDINIYKTAAVTARLRGDEGNYKMLLQRLMSLDPLCHFAAFERYFSARDTASRNAFTTMITSEMSYETYIELALWYFNAGLENEASTVMELCPENPLADYLSAYLAERRKDEAKSSFYLERANKADDKLVFPFRDEYAPILKWAEVKMPGWKTKYYSALLYWSKGQTDIADKYFTDCGDTPGSFSFYLARGNFRKQLGGSEEPDYLKALKYGENNWRPYHLLHGYYLSQNNFNKAAEISQLAMKKFSNLYMIRYDHAQSLLNTGKYEECVKILETTEILPNEGASNGRRIWRSANLRSAINNYSINKASKALVYAENAFEWPEKLGVGKPYSVDETVENFVKAMILDKMGKKIEAEALYHKLTDNAGMPRGASSVNYLTVLALKRLGLKAEAEKYFNGWLEQSRNKTMTEWAKLMNENQKEKAAALIRPDNSQTAQNVPDYAVVQPGPSASQGMRGSAGRGDADFEIVNEIVKNYNSK
jgi:tetratricopeptide (TPR) repeat protein